MKKAIVFFLLAVVAATGVFAQLTFSGDMYAGFQVEEYFGKDDKSVTSLLHRKEGAPKFNFVAAAARETYGVKLDVTFQTTNPFNLNGVYAWAGFLENALRLSLGKISDPVWLSSLDADHEEKFDDITGFRVDYKVPYLEGLNLGFAFTVDDFDVEKMFKKIILGASYVCPMFNTVIAYDNGNNARLLFGFNYTGMDDLTSAGIQIKAFNIATWESTVYRGRLELNEKVGYRVIRPLTVSLLMEQVIFGTPNTDPRLSFTVEGSYRIMPNLTGSLGLEIQSADLFNTQIISIHPYFEYTLKGPALLYAEYELSLAEYRSGSFHRFGFGIDIKAF
ncbi:MAG: hypothetical protein FWG46_02755 [Treponema sp.]|nr:hypothetical protein [Treponema sp.]